MKLRFKSIVLKLTNACNQACTYCYRESNKEKSNNIINFNILQKFFKSYASYCSENNIIAPSIIFHGGEPLLYNIDMFKNILRTIRTTKYLDQSFVSIQTNGTLLNSQWINLFNDYDVKLGISVDGPELVHDIHRKNKDGSTIFKNTFTGIMLAKKKLMDNLNYISVITNKNYMFVKEIYSFFKSIMRKSDIVDFIPVYCGSNNKNTLKPKNHLFFMKRIFNMWAEDGCKFTIRFLQDILLRLKGQTNQSSCELAGNCGFNLSLNFDGRAYFCECLPIKDEKFMLFNSEEGFFDALNNNLIQKRINNFLKLREKNLKGCQNCKWFKICRGGCLNRKLDGRSTDYYCKSRKALFSHVENCLKY